MDLIQADTAAPRKIIHIDADCFYAAIEIRDNPALQGLPVAVGGRADQRGVIATANYEARKFGIHSAMASATALKRCSNLILLPGRMAVYRQASKQMHAIFAEYTNLIEPLSLDEAFLDVSTCQQHQGSATLIAQVIRQRITDSIGITVSAGVAPNKFIAKIASNRNKPDGQCVVTPAQIGAFMADMPVRHIWGVGKVTAAKLEKLGITTCADVRDYDIFQLIRQLGQSGEHIYQLAHGIDHRPVVSESRYKSISVENTYAQDLPDLYGCIAQLPELLVALTKRLQKLDDDYCLNHCFLKMKFHDFSQTTVARQNTRPKLDDISHLCSQAWKRRQIPVRLLGIGVKLDDRPGAGRQMELFPRDLQADSL